MRSAAWVLVCAAVLWAASLPLAAYASSQTAGSPSSIFALAVYAIGSVICHQRPERSFHLWSAQLPVCARCTGIYLGAAIGAVVAAAIPLNAGTKRAVRPEADTTYARRRAPRWASTSLDARLALIVAMMPAALTLAYEWLTGDTPSNALRGLTGIVLGVATAWIVVRETLR
jgi:uncharacterized membrane protein